MDRITKRLAVLLLMLPVAGCGVEHELDLTNIDSLQYIHEGDIAYPQPLVLSAGNKKFTDLIDWLKQNRSGWQPLKASLLPIGLAIYGEGFDLRVVHQTAILRYRDQSGEYRQLQKKITAELFALLDQQ